MKATGIVRRIDDLGRVVIPKELTAATLDGRRIALTPKWERLSHIRFGTAIYLAQRAAESLYTPEGKKAVTLSGIWIAFSFSQEKSLS